MAVFVPPICLDKIVDYVVEFRENQQLEMNGNGTNVTSSGNITLEVFLFLYVLSIDVYSAQYLLYYKTQSAV